MFPQQLPEINFFCISVNFYFVSSNKKKKKFFFYGCSLRCLLILPCVLCFQCLYVQCWCGQDWGVYSPGSSHSAYEGS